MREKTSLDLRELRGAARLLALLLQIERGGEAGAAAADELEGEVAFVELRDELRAEPREHEQRKAEQREHRQHDEPAEAQAERRAAACRCAWSSATSQLSFSLDVAAEQERAEHRHEREREDERAAEREHHGEAIGLNIFPSMPVQREDRQIDDGDDEHAEEHRVRDFLARSAALRWARSAAVRRAAERVLPLAEMADDVFHHHDRAIDDEAEVDRAEAHQVAAEMPLAPCRSWRRAWRAEWRARR